MKMKSTKKALLTSVLSLLLCCAMLVGTTFAWFTDSVESGNNIIKSGNLDIELEYWDGDSWEDVGGKSDILTNELWEPGVTEVAYLRVANAGSLALNYQLGINIVSETLGKTKDNADIKLSNYIQFGVVENVNGETGAYANREDAVAAVTNAKPLNAGYTKAASMTADQELYLALVVWMPTSVGNEANHNGINIPSINLGINVLASQQAYEADSFGPNYDLLAQGGYISEAAPAAGETKEYNIMPTGVTGGDKIGTMNIPSAAVEDLTKPIEISVVPTEQDETVTVLDDEKALSFDITVSNIKADNNEAIKVELNVGKGLSGVKVFHKGTKIADATYDSNDGFVTFYTTSFSPYTVVFDAVYEAPEVEEPSESNLPKANVTVYKETNNIVWGNYGQWSPTAGLEANLEAAYTFACVDTQEQAVNSPYANWYCDFYVKLDKDLGVNQLFLGGNYGSFGWVGFHNGDVTLEANTEIGLLSSVTTNPWTYQDVATFVGEFICGVGDVDDALAGATFTVMLRLTNPEDETEFYNIETINYTFPEVAKVSTLTELMGAIKDGYKVIDAQGNNLGDFNYDGTFTDGVVVKNAKFTYVYGAAVQGTVTFENCEFVSDHSYSANFSDGNTTGNIIFNNCLFDGWNSFGTVVTNVEMNGCTFKWNNPYSMLRFYQNAQLNNCVFEAIEGIDNGEVSGTTITLTNCTGIEGKIYNNTLSNGTVMVSKWIVNGTELTDVPAW